MDNLWMDHAWCNYATRLPGLTRQCSSGTVRLYDNLRYGIEHEQGSPLSAIIQRADLYDVVDRLPDGLEDRAWVRAADWYRAVKDNASAWGGRCSARSIRLAVLDEPFRGLDRDKRRKSPAGST